MKKIIVIVGPTGVGKTKMSVELAKKLNGEIISGDSVQVYKRMNIGSAKVKDEEKVDMAELKKLEKKAGSKRSRKKKANRYDEDDEVIEYNFKSSKDK